MTASTRKDNSGAMNTFESFKAMADWTMSNPVASIILSIECMVPLAAVMLVAKIFDPLMYSSVPRVMNLLFTPNKELEAGDSLKFGLAKLPLETWYRRVLVKKLF